MLFSSSVFLFGYLPVVVLLYFVLARASHRYAALWLTAASIFFYGWWDAAFVPLLLASMTVNFMAGSWLARRAARGLPVRRTLVLALVFNLALLGYFKYANFFLANVSGVIGADFPSIAIALPIGISFFTFTQIAYLVDASRGQAREYDPVHYSLFVSYFPHLVAGPILHHREMMPQFALPATYRAQWENFAVGLTIITIGLFKKVVIADGLAPVADSAFSAAAAGKPLALFEAWTGTLAYTFQLYFDFSGYSDMAIGISRLFGVRLPVNFDSPYKAANIAEFWKRWHMTLSRFLRDYLYVPLGGNRLGQRRLYANLLITMLLGGLWHGAGWTFVLWGALHGAGLAAHRAFRSTGAACWLDATGAPGRFASTMLTFTFVVVGWVFFRAESTGAALVVLSGMAGLAPGGTPNIPDAGYFLILLAVGAAVWALPNTQQIMARFEPALPVYRPIVPAETRPISWLPTRAWLAVSVLCGWMALYWIFTGRESPFLYFNF